MEKAINGKKQKTKMTLDDLWLMIGRGFNAGDKRFDSVDEKFNSVNARLAVLEVGSRERNWIKLRKA